MTRPKPPPHFLSVLALCCIVVFRGWVWTDGIDDMETECGLDDLKHDIVIDNSEEGSGQHLIQKLKAEVK